MGIDPASIAVKAALMAAQMAMTAMNKTEGPRLDSTDVSLADYGTPLTRFWGIRRLEGCPIIWAEKLRERKIESKTKGGKYSEYKYYGTFAVLIADHEIDGISRLWLDKHLCFDVTKPGPISPIAGLLEGAGDDSAVKLSQGRNFRIYLGTEDQQPDPRMEAWCEDRYGADSCPAYRGVSYIVFQDVPLEKFGNRIPQVTVEAVSNKSDAYPFEYQATEQSNGAAMALSPSGEWLAYVDSGDFEWWDVASRTKIGTSGEPNSYAFNVALANDGTAYQLGAYFVGVDVAVGLYVTPPMGATTRIDSDSIYYGRTQVFDVGANRYVLSAAPAPGYIDFTTFIELAQCARGFFLDAEARIWAVTQPDGSSNQFGLTCIVGTGATATFTGTATRGDVTDANACHVASEGHYFVVTDGYWYTIDDSTMAIKDSGPTTGWGDIRLPTNNPEAISFWVEATERSLVDGSVIRTVSGWATGQATHRWAYDPISHAVISRPQFVSSLYWLYIDRIGSDGVTLGDIVEDVAGWCDIDTVDATALDQVVTGYSVSQGSGKDMIAPLLDIHDCDARPHDFGIQFIKRGQASGGTILTADFVRDGDSPRYTVTKVQDTDLARRQTINFSDVGKDQQGNTVISQRPLDTVDGVREQSIDLHTYVATPAEAQQLSDRRFRRLWNEREEIQNGVTMQEIALEPADVRLLSLDGVTRYCRLTKMTLTQGHIACEWRRDALSLNGLGSGEGAEMEGRDPEVIFVQGLVKGIALDIPLTEDIDADASPLIYYGAGKFGSSNFAGATVFKLGADGYEAWGAVDSAASAAWGYATDTLGDANPWLWDRGNTLNVNCFTALTSTTEAAINADPSVNQAVIGNEIINFTTAFLEADGTYTLSGFRRGRRGTEWACSTHEAGEVFVLASSLNHEGLGLSEVGADLSFKAQSPLRDVSTAQAIPITFEGNSLKPYAPARIEWTTDGTDMFGTIVRRTRVGGAWQGGSTIPLSENSEAYEVDIYNGATFKRTITVTGTNAFTYAAAEIAADGNTVGVVPPFNAYQMSDAVGRGFALAA